MIGICNRSFRRRFTYFQAYISILLLGCAGYFFIQLLYCQSQVNILSTVSLNNYRCIDICPLYSHASFIDQYICCDQQYSNCVSKAACLNSTINIFIDKQNFNGVLASIMVALIPLLILIHLVLRICLRRYLYRRLLR